MIEFQGIQLNENCIIEFCVLPRYSLKTLLENIISNLEFIFLDTKGFLSALYQYEKDKNNHSKKKLINSDIFRIQNLKEFLKCFEELKQKKDKIIFFDSLPSLIDTFKDKKNIFLVLNIIWELIYFNNFTFIVINHYRIIDKSYAPRLGYTWILNVSYRILIKSIGNDTQFLVVQTPEERIKV